MAERGVQTPRYGIAQFGIDLQGDGTAWQGKASSGSAMAKIGWELRGSAAERLGVQRRRGDRRRNGEAGKGMALKAGTSAETETIRNELTDRSGDAAIRKSKATNGLHGNAPKRRGPERNERNRYGKAWNRSRGADARRDGNATMGHDAPRCDTAER